MLMHRLGRLIVRAASLLTTLALLAGLPAALAVFVGWPLPRRVPTDWAGWAHVLTGGFPDAAVINLLAVALWLVWAAFCYSLAGEIAAARRGRPARQVRAISPLQALAALLVAGMSAGPAAAASAALVVPPAVVTTVAPPPITASTATATPSAPASGPLTRTALPWLTVTTVHQPAQLVAATDLPSRPTATGTAAAAGLPRFALVSQNGPLTVTAGGQHYTVTVHRGDTLWDLAQEWLGDPHRWPEIYHLNADRYDQHGRMRGGDHIEPTWVLVLPDDATPPAGAQPGNPPQQDSGTQTEPGPGQSTAPSPSTDPTPSASATPSPSTSSANPTPSATGPSAAPSNAPSATTDPDGVVGPPPAGSTSPSPSASDPAPTRSPSAAPNRPHGITLPSGSWLDLGLASAIVAAVALVWAHRRRRYTRRPPSPDLRMTDPDLAPMPPVVNQVRRRLRGAAQSAAAQGDPQDPAQFDLFTDPDATLDDERLPAHDDDDTGVGIVLDVDVADRTVPADPDDDEGDEGDEDFLDGAAEEPLVSSPSGGDEQSPAVPRPAVPSLAHPLAAVWPPAGLGLTGPGAEAAARGFLAAGLAAGGLDEPDERSWVVMPSATAATLLGTDAVALPHTPRLTVTGGLDEALDLLEAQTLHRSRMVYAHEVDTVAELRAADPTEEPLPPMLLVADATTRHQRTRIAALLAQGQRLDIHGVLLGAWPDGNTVVVAADGTTSPADGEGGRHGNHPADIGRLAILTPAETSDLLVTLAESHTGQPQAPAPVEPAAHLSPAAEAGPIAGDTDAQPHLPTLDPAAGPPSAAGSGVAPAAGPGNPCREQPDTAPGGMPAEPGGPADDSADPPPAELAPVARVIAPGSAEGTADAATAGQHPALRPDGEAHDEAVDDVAEGTDLDSDEDPDIDASSEEAETGPGRVEVTVLGPAGIVDVPPGPTLRKKSVEVLVYLAVHDGDASAETILDDVMPDAPANKAPRRLYTYVSNLRTVMRHTGGRGAYIGNRDQRYILNPDAIDIDLWRMRAAIRDADRATDPAERLAALRRAVDTYGGHLAEGADYEWIEPYREAVRTQALDAYLALAEALADKPAEQVSVLEAAIRHNPYAEELYQQAMRARAALGHLDAIRTLRRTLTRALGEIDAEPSDETIALADELVAQAQRPGRRPDLRPAPRPGDGAAA